MTDKEIQSKNNFVTKYSDINIDNVMCDDFVMTTDGKHIVSKIWYRESKTSQPHSFYIQTKKVKLHEVPLNENEDILLVLDDASIFENLDKKIVGDIRSSGVHKKYSMVKPTYKSTVNNPDDNDNTNLLRLKIGNCKWFYKDKNPRNTKDIFNLHLLEKESYVRAIIEVNMITLNVSQNFIFTNLILKQIQIIPTMPKIVDITEYSFIDDEPQDVESNSFVNIDNVILNTQTEYMMESTELPADKIIKSDSSLSQKTKNNLQQKLISLFPHNSQ